MTFLSAGSNASRIDSQPLHDDQTSCQLPGQASGRWCFLLDQTMFCSRTFHRCRMFQPRLWSVSLQFHSVGRKKKKKKKKKKTKNFTLVVMELMRMMPVQLVQDLDNVSIGIGPTEGVSSAIEAENKLVGLSGLVSNGGNHSCRWRQWKSWSIGRDSPTSLCFLYT